MISDDLYRLADRIAGDVLHEHTPSPQELAAIAQQLMAHAKTAHIMETLPFEVAAAAPVLDLLPQMVFVRALAESATRAWPDDLGPATQERWR